MILRGLLCFHRMVSYLFDLFWAAARESAAAGQEGVLPMPMAMDPPVLLNLLPLNMQLDGAEPASPMVPGPPVLDLSPFCGGILRSSESLGSTGLSTEEVLLLFTPQEGAGLPMSPVADLVPFYSDPGVVTAKISSILLGGGVESSSSPVGPSLPGSSAGRGDDVRLFREALMLKAYPESCWTLPAVP